MKKLRKFIFILTVSIALSHHQSFTLPKNQSFEGLVLGSLFTVSAAGLLTMAGLLCKSSMDKNKSPKDKRIDRAVATISTVPAIALWLMNMTLIPAPQALNKAIEGFLVRNFFSPIVRGPVYKPGNR